MEEQCCKGGQSGQWIIMDSFTAKMRQEEYGKGKWLLFDEISVGMEFPSVEFEITTELVEKYCTAVGENNPIFFDAGAAREKGFNGRVAPSAIVCIYAIPSALLSGFRPKVIPPPGNIHYRQEYEFLNPAGLGDRISVKSVVVSKEVRRGRKYITIESQYINQEGSKIAVGRITPIWAK
jgi:3-hydroxybutyryl-CoA dehydratase